MYNLRDKFYNKLGFLHSAMWVCFFIVFIFIFYVCFHLLLLLFQCISLSGQWRGVMQSFPDTKAGLLIPL